MAHVDRQCSLLLEDGTPCRRGADYVCGRWHLVCAAHGAAGETTGCPLCGVAVRPYASLDASDRGTRRATDRLFGSMGAFFARARAELSCELHDEPACRDADLETESP